MAQMSQFNQSVGVSGIALTKLDGTAKGGVIFALAEQFSTPIRFIGVGEKQEDLQSFVPATLLKHLWVPTRAIKGGLAVLAGSSE